MEARALLWGKISGLEFQRMDSRGRRGRPQPRVGADQQDDSDVAKFVELGVDRRRKRRILREERLGGLLEKLNRPNYLFKRNVPLGELLADQKNADRVA